MFTPVVVVLIDALDRLPHTLDLCAHVPHDALRVYVMGEVLNPGVVPLRAGMTLQQAIAVAGNFATTGAEDSVLLLRDAGPGVRTAEKIDVTEDNMVLADVELRPFDLIYVPRTGVARVSLWFNQHISQLLPRGVRIIAINVQYSAGNIIP